MLNSIIKYKALKWLKTDDCSVKSLVKYIRSKGELRDTQIQAIEIYLFLKIKGENKPLWQLFSEGFFIEEKDLKKIPIHYMDTMNFLLYNTNAHALYDFASKKYNGKYFLPELTKLILEKPESIDYEKIIKSIFYNVNYADYLMSLPMGAGKTFLIAAFIYLDLYFADNEPNNKNFAHNFLVLIPSGLKSSIVPSLKTIENFDPTWVLPEPSASKIKKMLKFDILDQAKTGNKSNKARNPNAQKVNQCLPEPFGQIFVVNAEKVILNRVYIEDTQRTYQHTEDEKDKYANELRNLIGKIPNLTILIDEVHHATDGDIKLRKVVNKWTETGNITTVFGFSGTPYLSKADKINVTGTAFFKFSQITNTVYYYPLVTAIKNFLKTPKVKVAQNLDKFQIIEKAIHNFNEQYKNTVYENGNIAKLAIYCSNIKSLEEEIYPYLTGTLKINPDEILKFHKGNKKFTLPKENQLLFNTLDVPKTLSATKKRYILLVQIGKEGWDSPSLTSVVLSQKGDSPKNMVLQTSCRCLRQVDKNKHETALIWLNEYNATVLNQQLKKEQQTSIEELNKLKPKEETEQIERFSRQEYLDLPKVEFYQLKITYNTIDEEENANTKIKLETISSEIDNYKKTALIKTSELDNINDADLKLIENTGHNFASYNQWVFDISKESFNKITVSDLLKFKTELNLIFDKITFTDNETIFFNELYDLYQINSKIRLAFSIKRNLQTETEVVDKKANLLIVDKLKAVEQNEKLFPNEQDTTKILELDERNAPTKIEQQEIKKAFQILKDSFEKAGMLNMIPKYEDYKKQYDYSSAVKSKNKTFHYLPYDFKQSGFEKEILQKTLNLEDFKNKDLEIYYNGERGLTEFVINCYAKENKYWKNIGKYTTDFLIIKRKNKEINKALIIETKGKGFENDPVFQAKRKFVETEFLEQNKEKFGYNKFDFLYLVDSDDMPTNLSKLSSKINNFFNE
ncbi:MAG: DEAD/DEAH box helicase family protein [Bacteroidota bacterium]|nr:DEAD/DEAH box helicase family protein [Bacteroidota bacterium]